MTRRRIAARGFTLIEVMVALAVVAIGLAAAIRIGANNAANAAYLRDKTLAQWVAENKTTELLLQTSWPPTGSANGSSTMAGSQWYWQTLISATADPRVRRLEVSAGREQDHPMVHLVAFLPQPSAAVSPPAPAAGAGN